MKGRFAPSPTGHIHLGNVWIALLSYLSCKAQGGDFILRIEDIDKQRSKPELGQALLDDLEWLGFSWDQGPRVSQSDDMYWQSHRDAIYDEQITKWLKSGDIYPCFCNRARLQAVMSAPHVGDTPIMYDGHCRYLTKVEQEQLQLEKEPSYRLKVKDRIISFDDKYKGHQSFSIKAGIDDFVVKRADQMFAYNLAVVLDDIAMGVTEVIRGMDLLETTALQVYLYDLLGKTRPVYGHAPLLIDREGHRLSKRQSSITVAELRQSGMTSQEILGNLVKQTGLVSEIYLDSQGRISLAQLEKIPLNLSTLKKINIIV